jgi:hypothetical protein
MLVNIRCRQSAPARLLFDKKVRGRCKSVTDDGMMIYELALRKNRSQTGPFSVLSGPE